MKKIFLSLCVALAFAAYVAVEHSKTGISYLSSLFTEKNDDETGVVIPPANNSVVLEPAVSAPVVPAVQQGIYKNGEYTGKIVDAYYGNVQVKAVIQNGRIADVQFLDYPNHRRTSVVINSQAMPYLKQEAIQAQNANVDTISGATYTSDAFRHSLVDALGQAKN